MNLTIFYWLFDLNQSSDARVLVMLVKVEIILIQDEVVIVHALRAQKGLRTWTLCHSRVLY